MKTRMIFDRDRMTAEERFQAVIRLEKPDRVPSCMMIYNYAPFHTGTKFSDYIKKHETYMQVMHRVYEDVGPWDIYWYMNSGSRLTVSYGLMMRYLYPGDELPENEMIEVDEVEYMHPEDYDWILALKDKGADYAMRTKLMPRFCKEAAGKGALRLFLALYLSSLKQKSRWDKDFKWAGEQGLAMLYGYIAEAPFDTLSQARTTSSFSLDLLRRPAKIHGVCDKLALDWAVSAVKIARAMGVPRVVCALHRSSNSFISPRQFAELAYPSLEIICNTLVDNGMTPVLHCDGDWLRNLKTLRRLPAGKIVLQLDGTTDIFKAKEEIGDRMCLYGDVPAGLLALGSTQQVDEYCHRLIEEVGKDGGFIVAAGCEIPYNAKPENLKVMSRSAYKYGYY
jgi:uroporphyrinogen-III decarboxylase